jgi:hydroxymethylglutaryl-CoA lyase
MGHAAPGHVHPTLLRPRVSASTALNPIRDLDSKGQRAVVYEVGPRDGLQNEAASVPLAARIAFVDALSASGLSVIEVGAFVHPARVPAMADSDRVFAGIARRASTRYTALVPNRRGLERALGANVDAIAVFAAASETFSQRNINHTIEESLDIYAQVVTDAHGSHIPARGYLSTVFGCPFEGAVSVPRVVQLTQRLLEIGVYEVSISDTIGVAHPAQVRQVLDAVLTAVPADRIAVHFHDTHGMAVANVAAALEMGIRTIDSAAGGLGGCPYAPGATGNLATEDLLYLLTGLGYATGVGADLVADASLQLEPIIGHRLPSRALQADVAARQRAARPPH